MGADAVVDRAPTELLELLGDPLTLVGVLVLVAADELVGPVTPDVVGSEIGGILNSSHQVGVQPDFVVSGSRKAALPGCARKVGRPFCPCC